MLTKNAIRLSVGELGSRVPLLLLELSLARMLGPAVYGIWSILQTFATYGNFLHLGVSSSMARREPGLLERGLDREVAGNRSAAYGFQLLVIGVITILLLAISHLHDDALDAIGGVFVVLALLLVIMGQQFMISTQASALNEYKVLASSIARLIYAFSFLAIGLTVVRFEPPLLWLTLGWAVALGIALIVLHFSARGILVMPRIDFSRTKSMLLDGFPIMLQGLLRFVLMSVDKLTVYWWARPEAVGFYGVGALAAGVTGLLGSMIARVSLPTLLRLRENSDGFMMIQAEFDRMIVLIQLLIFSGVLSVCALAPLLIYFTLPDYEPAMRVVGILAAAGGFAGLAQAMSDVTMSFGVKAAVLRNTWVTLLLQVFFLGIAWNAGAGIEGVATSVLIAMSLMSGRTFWLCMRTIGLARDVARHRLIRLSVRAAIALTVCFGVLEIQIICIEYLQRDIRPVLLANTFLWLVISTGLMMTLRRLWKGQRAL